MAAKRSRKVQNGRNLQHRRQQSTRSRRPLTHSPPEYADQLATITTSPDYDRAESLYRQALAHLGLDDRGDVQDRLDMLYTDEATSVQAYTA